MTSPPSRRPTKRRAGRAATTSSPSERVAAPLVTPIKEEVAQVVETVVAKQPWRSPLLYFGLGMVVAGALALLVIFLTWRSQAFPILLATGMLFAFGKESGIPGGILAGGDPFVIGGALLWLDAAMSFVLYPFVEVAMQGAQRQKGVIGHMVRGARRRADRKRPLVDKYGGMGLFLFMIVPFGFNGPLIGMVLGRLAGLTARAILVAVMLAITATTVAWTLLWERLEPTLGAWLPEWAPPALAVTIAAIALTSSFIAGRREKRREEAEALERLARKSGAPDE